MAGSVMKRLAARLPGPWQQELKRVWFGRQLRQDRFRTPEPEWQRVEQWLRPGDWAIDVGANVGHYTKKFSDVVGPTGRVIAFEPVPTTFELLSANVCRFRNANVTLLNMAASTASDTVAMSMPFFGNGLPNPYEAAINPNGEGLKVLTCSIDGLGLKQRVALLKVDAEGHDSLVLRGAMGLIERDRPTLIVESGSAEVDELTNRLGYRDQTITGSSNRLFVYPRQ